LKILGFKHVNGGQKFKIGDRQVDACGGHEKTILIVECTTQKDLGSKMDSFRGSIGEKIRAFKQDEKYKGYDKFKVVLAVRDTTISETNLKRASENQPRIYIWDDDLISYYTSLQKTIRDAAKYSLLAELNVKPEREEIVDLPAFSISLGKKATYRMFVFAMEASQLMRYAYVARREAGGENYYQRMVKKNRLSNIGKYIDKGMVFPNSIVVALSDNSWSYKKLPIDIHAPNWQAFGKLTLERSFSTCWIIDGQHRLYAHGYTTVPGKLVVTAFANISEEKQAEYFLDINKEAKKVDVNLLWDLLGSINPGSTEGIVSNAAKLLRGFKGGVFEDNIKVPSLGSGIFSFNNICVNLEESEMGAEQIARRYKVRKNPFWNKDPDTFSTNLARGVNRFFLSLDSVIEDSKKEFLYSDGFVAVMIRIFKLLVVHLAKRPTKVDLAKFSEIIGEYLNQYSEEDGFKLRKSLSSIGGKTDFRNDVVRILQESYDTNFAVGLIDKSESLAEQINHLEIDLNRLIDAVYSHEFGEGWVTDPSIIKDGKLRKTILSRAKRANSEPWEFINFGYAVNYLLLNPSIWKIQFETLFIKNGMGNPEDTKIFARRVWDYRSNKLAHKRSKPVIYSREEEALIKSIYQMFRKVIDEAYQIWSLQVEEDR
jgi:DGQHR domain-containing protein